MSKTVKCKWCGKETGYLHTKMCDFCYNLSSLIEMKPELARKMINKMFGSIDTNAHFPE